MMTEMIGLLATFFENSILGVGCVESADLGENDIAEVLDDAVKELQPRSQ